MQQAEWKPDFLGEGFSYLTIPLTDNEDGPGDTTLIRYQPSTSDHTNKQFKNQSSLSDPQFAMLYVHGWNDYFYHTHVAKAVHQAKGSFYAIDLRAYGRSLRDWQTPGWTSDIRSYDEDINRALHIIRKTHPNLPIVIAGHSTGGLITSFWAHRHPKAIDALVINSPWLDTQISPIIKAASTPLLASISTTYDPRQIIPTPDSGFYQRAITGYRDTDEKIPAGEEDDIFWAPQGWNPNPAWRNNATHPTRAGWLWAIIEAQKVLAENANIQCPILVIHSARSYDQTEWSDQCRYTDTVLDVTQIRDRGYQLGPHVTLVAVENALHDVFISKQIVRNNALTEIKRWLITYATKPQA